MIVGYAGNGTLTIRNGGMVNNAYGFIGADPGSIGVATVEYGAGSNWTNAGKLYIGQIGNGTVYPVRNGGTLNSDVGYIGSDSTSTSTATSRWRRVRPGPTTRICMSALPPRRAEDP